MFAKLEKACPVGSLKPFAILPKRSPPRERASSWLVDPFQSSTHSGGPRQRRGPPDRAAKVARCEPHQDQAPCHFSAERGRGRVPGR